MLLRFFAISALPLLATNILSNPRQAWAKGTFPPGPSQQCRDDAGPPWVDDNPKRPYYKGFAAKPKLDARGKCPKPLEKACAAKGALAAFHDGPINCGGKGWFCILEEQKGHMAPGARPGRFPDSNFAFCSSKDNDSDRDGHCHGSDVDNVYGWWVRDHWHRNYAGKLRCCCNWGNSVMRGYVNRCDYRKYVSPGVRRGCRDANEEHRIDWNPGCGKGIKRQTPPPQTCWEMEGFGPAKIGEDGSEDDGEGDEGDEGDEDDGNDEEEDDDNDDEGGGDNSFCGRAKKRGACKRGKKFRRRCKWQRKRCISK